MLFSFNWITQTEAEDILWMEWKYCEIEDECRRCLIDLAYDLWLPYENIWYDVYTNEVKIVWWYYQTWSYKHFKSCIWKYITKASKDLFQLL